MTRSIAVFTLLAAAAPLCSQEVFERRIEAVEAGAVVGWTAQASSTDAVFLHGPGIRFEGPPKTGAPYSAEAVTETTQTLADGNRIRRENRSKVYRDSEGRTRREETLQAVGPWAVASEQPTRITVFINDPVAGVHWVLEPDKKIARKMQIPSIEEHVAVGHGAPMMVSSSSFGVATAVPANATAPVAFARRIEAGIPVPTIAATSEQPNVEDLGTRMIEGVEAKGTKITRTIPAGEIGNDRPIEIVFERWHSEALGVDVMTRRSDPRSAENTYTLTNIQQTEPLPSMFQPPPDYEIREPEGDILFDKVETKELK